MHTYAIEDIYTVYAIPTYLLWCACTAYFVFPKLHEDTDLPPPTGPAAHEACVNLPDPAIPSHVEKKMLPRRPTPPPRRQENRFRAADVMLRENLLIVVLGAFRLPVK